MGSVHLVELISPPPPTKRYNVFRLGRMSDPDTCIRLLTGNTTYTPASRLANCQAPEMFQQLFALFYVNFI
jgi:hypothetical protein